MTPIRKTIDDPNAPARLWGEVIVIVVDTVKRKLSFQIDLPDDATPQETGYLRWFIGEWVDNLREQFPFIGEQTFAGFVDSEEKPT